MVTKEAECERRCRGRRTESVPEPLAGDGRPYPLRTKMRVSRPTTGSASGSVEKRKEGRPNCQRHWYAVKREVPWARAPRSSPPAAGDEGTLIDRSPHRGPCVGGPHAPPPPALCPSAGGSLRPP